MKNKRLIISSLIIATLVVCVLMNLRSSDSVSNGNEPTFRTLSQRSQRAVNLQEKPAEYLRLANLIRAHKTPHAANQMGMYCRAQIAERGDYRYIFLAIADASESEKYEILRAVIGISSPSGLEDDFVNQLDLLSGFTTAKGGVLKNRLYDRVASDYQLKKNPEFLSLVPTEDLGLFSSRLANSYNRDFFLVASDIEKRTNTFRYVEEGVSILLDRDGIETSSMISALNSGSIKDHAILQMTKWLRGKGSLDEAEAWATKIENLKIRAEATPIAKPGVRRLDR